MTDRYHSLTVVLTEDMRTDDAERVLDAIRMIRGVQSVTGIVADASSHMAYQRARRDLGDKLFEVIYPKDEK